MKTFQWLFCIFNSLQGLFLFVQYIVRNHDLQVQVRSLWKSLSIKPRKKRACYSFTNGKLFVPSCIIFFIIRKSLTSYRLFYT